jgi:hypothetical protein
MPRWAAAGAGLLIGLSAGPLAHLASTPGRAQAQPPATPAPAPVQPAPRTFKTPVGLIFSQVKPEQAPYFEAAIGRLRTALAASSDPALRQQAVGWHFFKAQEPGPSGSVLYVWIVNPTVPDADYTVSKILAAAAPEDQTLLSDYADSFAGPETLLNLEPLGAAKPAGE